MALPEVFNAPTKVLGGVTAVAAALIGVFAFGQNRGTAPFILVVLGPVVVLGLLARGRKDGRAWLYLAIAWVLGALALSYLVGAA